MMNAKPKRRSLALEDVRLMFRNFGGEEGRFNKEGERFFHVALDEALGLELEEEGWNVKWLNSREDEPPLGHIKCEVNFHPERRPPKVVLITHSGTKKTRLDEETVFAADMVDIETADVILGAYHWSSPGIGKGWGIKAYANEVWIHVKESEFDVKYAELEEVSVGSRVPTQIEAPEDQIEDLGERMMIDE